MAVTSTISPIQVGSGQGKKTLYTATKVTGPFGSPPKYETEIIRYDNAKGEGGKTIGTRSSDNPGKIEWNANASRLDKQNQKKIGQASAGQESLCVHVLLPPPRRCVPLEALWASARR